MPAARPHSLDDLPTRPWEAIGAPIDCVGAEPGAPAFGTELAPKALRAAGLVSGLTAGDAGDLPVRLVGSARDPVSGLVGGSSVPAAVGTVRAAVAQLVRNGSRPLVIGGCCTALMGALPGARDALGEVGLVYLDGHLDMYDHVTSPTGEAADMPIAALLGVGAPSLLDSMQPLPVAALDRVSLLGPRDRDEATSLGSLLPEQMGVWCAEVAPVARSPAVTARQAVDRAGGGGCFWAHLDVDVLDEAVFPATDYLMPGGLTIDQLRQALRVIGADPRLIGFSLGCYNPEKDPDGRFARQLRNLLVETLGGDHRSAR